MAALLSTWCVLMVLLLPAPSQANESFFDTMVQFLHNGVQFVKGTIENVFKVQYPEPPEHFFSVADPLIAPLPDSNSNTYTKPDISLPVKIIDHNSKESAHEDREFEGITPTKLLCMVTTYPENHMKKAIHVKNTWGKRCDTLLFMSTEEEPALPTIKLAINSSSRQYLWPKARAANRYLYEHYLNSADWFLKADDDTYVIIENLRRLLSKYRTDEPIYFGLKLQWEGQIYMNGGAGYVLSRESLSRIGQSGDLTPNKDYDQLGSDEDIKMAKLLNRVGAKAEDSRDERSRQRFFMYPPQDYIFPDKSSHYWNYSVELKFEGLDGCSNSVVSFHYIRPKDMYALEYLIYHLRSYHRFDIEQKTETVIEDILHLNR